MDFNSNNNNNNSTELTTMATTPRRARRAMSNEPIKKASLLGIPGEIRNKIYEYALTAENQKVFYKSKNEKLVGVVDGKATVVNQLQHVKNKQLRWETENLELRYNVVWFCEKFDKRVGNDLECDFLKKFLEQLKPHQQSWAVVEVSSLLNLMQLRGDPSRITGLPWDMVYCDCPRCARLFHFNALNPAPAQPRRQGPKAPKPKKRGPKQRCRNNGNKPQDWNPHLTQVFTIADLCKAYPQVRVHVALKHWTLNDGGYSEFRKQATEFILRGAAVSVAFADNDEDGRLVTSMPMMPWFTSDARKTVQEAKQERENLGFDTLFQGAENLKIFPGFNVPEAEKAVQLWRDPDLKYWKELVLKWAEHGVKVA